MIARLGRLTRASLLSLPLWSGIWLASAQEDFERHLAKARSNCKTGRYSDAAAEFQQAYDSTVTGQGERRAQIAFEWLDCDILLGHYGDALNLVSEKHLSMIEGPSGKARVFFLKGEALCGNGDYHAAENSYDQALQQDKRASGGSSADSALYYTGLGESQRLQARVADAEATLHKALAIEEAQSSSRTVVHAATLAALGDLARSRERYAEANDRYAAAKPILEAVGGEPRPVLARVLLGLGELALIQNRTTEARSQLKQAQSFCNNLKDSQVFASVQDAIGRLELIEEDFDAALQKLKSAYDSRRDLGEGHPDTATSMDHLGLLYLAQDKLGEASDLLAKGEKTRRQALGPDHPDLALSLNHLSIADRKQQNYAEAERCITGALRIQTSLFGENSLAVADSRYQFGNLRFAQQKLGDAERAYRQALALQSKLLSANHPQRLETVLSLADVLHASEQDVESHQLLEGWMKAGGETLPHRDRLRASTILAEIQLHGKQYADAERSLKGILTDAASSPLLPRIRLALAETLYYESKFKDAATLYALVIPNLPATSESADIWQRLGDSYRAQKQLTDAAHAYREAFEIRQRNLGRDDSKTIVSLIALGDCLLDNSNVDEAEKYLSLFRLEGAVFTQDVLPVAEKLALALRARRLSDKAEPYLRRALELVKQAGMREQTDRILVELAENCADQGKRVDAAQLYEQRSSGAARRPAEAQKYLELAEQLREKAEGPNSPSLVLTLERLGDVYLDQALGANPNQEKLAAAKRVFERAQTILEASGQPDDTRLAASCNGLGMVAQAQGDAAQASKLYEKAYVLVMKPHDPSRAVLAAILYNQGLLASQNNHHEEADKFFSQCLGLLDAAFSRDDPPPLKQLAQIAANDVDHGRFADAEKWYQKSEVLSSKVFGEDSIEHATQLANLAGNYSDRTLYAKASELYEHSLRIFQEKVGPDSSEARNAMWSLASVYREMKDYRKAVAILEKYRQILQNSNPIDRNEATRVLNDLASGYKGLEEYPKVVQTYDTIAGLWQSEGYNEDSYFRARMNLAVALEYNKDHTRGQTVFREVQKALKRQENRNHEQELLTKYSEGLRRMGYPAEANKLQRQLKKI